MTYNVVKVIDRVVLDGWRRPVTILLTHCGETFMTEFNHDKAKTGIQELKIADKNSYGFKTVIL